MNTSLAPFALFAGMLAMAGLPIYIHAPKFYVDEFGVSLAALGTVLFVLRLIDVVQDPALGWLSRRLAAARGTAVAIAVLIMALAMFGLFGVTPPIAPIAWFAITLALLFSAFSFLTISFYAEGVSKAKRLDGDGHVRLAGWREQTDRPFLLKLFPGDHFFIQSARTALLQALARELARYLRVSL